MNVLLTNARMVTNITNYDMILLFSDIDECVNEPCQNNGSCTDAVNAYICKCLLGYGGTTCESGLVSF